jgi:hypothetical protein
MKNRNNQLTAVLFVVAFALTSIVQAERRPDDGPVYLPANDCVSANSEASSIYSMSSQDVQLPVITIHSTHRENERKD